MKVFHEVQSDTAEAILQNGLRLGEEGTKTDRSISRTDTFLNKHRPASVIKKGLNRVTNTYCYLPRGDKIINITSGEDTPLEFFTNKNRQTLLAITVDARKCYVGDLDLFDTIMHHLGSGNIRGAEELAPIYWDKVTLLSQYQGEFRRPEVIIPYSVPPHNITKAINI